MTQVVGTAFEREFRKLIEDRIAALIEGISAGMLASFDEYKHMSGKIAGLRAALDACDETNTKLSER